MPEEYEIILPIYGMSCQKCVAKVTSALQETEGVVSVDVSLQNSSGTVVVSQHGPTRDKLLQVIVKAGFQVVENNDNNEEEASTESVKSLSEDEDQEAVFSIQGMTCANCAQTIEKGVAKMPGVKSATVNFAAEKLSVVYDPGSLQKEDLLSQVDGL
ncbi:MAG: copper ion binding protein, partial [Gammaproteobacteria bacterium]|nr:copper ion binding protein [Gammaproteobacteria bacterium]NIR49434.1 copper ion binding protein [candidate division KSB1 bacterium]NIV44613.1 copper ion binding protein [Candidatus Bathyarchaeota archaeon]NIS24885.1 copper ion binding protein [candidate division KSB1 bacterium]NIU25523.1 copper ion binding protein [candidate division KSB1 bacterium]